MRLTLVTPPAVEPVALEEAKAHLRVDVDDDDTLILALIAAAREQAEAFTRRALITQTWDMALDCLPGVDEKPIELPKPTLQSVTSITYLDASGDEQTLAADQYQVLTGGGPYAQPGKVVRAYNVSWPSTRSQPDAVTVRFVAGYGDAASDVPAAIRQAILMLVGDLYEHREGIVVGAGATSLPRAAAAILAPYRILRL